MPDMRMGHGDPGWIQDMRLPFLMIPYSFLFSIIDVFFEAKNTTLDLRIGECLNKNWRLFFFLSSLVQVPTYLMT